MDAHSAYYARHENMVGWKQYGPPESGFDFEYNRPECSPDYHSCIVGYEGKTKRCVGCFRFFRKVEP